MTMMKAVLLLLMVHLKASESTEPCMEHSYVDVRGLSLHVAHIGKVGSGPAVVFLHGFPEIWYTWKHQMIAVSEAGRRAVAPDSRGYGLSSVPADVTNTTWEDLVDDLLSIFISLCIHKAFLVAKDFGVKPAFDFALRHPSLVSGVVTMGVPFSPIGFSPVGYNYGALPQGFYITRWQEPGRAEADFGRLDVKTVIRNIYIMFSRANLPIAQKGQEIMDLVNASTPLPSWFSDEDLTVYSAMYEKSGFKFPLHIPYRSIKNIVPTVNPLVRVPALLIMGEKDYLIKFPGMEDYVRSGRVKQYVPDLETVFVPEGSHFVQEQFPDRVNKFLINFINNHV